jgi:hypothetical protein
MIAIDHPNDGRSGHERRKGLTNLQVVRLDLEAVAYRNKLGIGPQIAEDGSIAARVELRSRVVSRYRLALTEHNLCWRDECRNVAQGHVEGAGPKGSVHWRGLEDHRFIEVPVAEVKKYDRIRVCACIRRASRIIPIE